MPELQVMLTSDEHDLLEELLQAELKEARVEGHRTRTPSYREHITHREDLISGLLKKLQSQCSTM